MRHSLLLRAAPGVAWLLPHLPGPVVAQDPGGSEDTPSVAFYFDWINSQYEGTTEAHTLVNFAFFQWLHDEYGMELDVYSLDVGNVDDGPYTAGVGRLIPDHHGDLQSAEFRAQFPRGFGPLAEAARGFGARLGLWLGPDGFGHTPAEEQARVDLVEGLCRDFDFRLLKFDAVAGNLRAEKQDAFIRAVEAARRHCPDLIVLNERVELGKAAPQATTHLWEGAETYIDVFSWNDRTAPHHRAGALSRPNPPGLTRRLEDHGVCLSSCLDAWDDDLVLQAFARSSILAPEIYGTPALLRDDEFPRFARLVNLHRRFRDLLRNGMELPEETCGPHAISRGDDEVRFLVLRNLGWEPVTYRVRLGDAIGLAGEGDVELRRFHPRERVLGTFPHGHVVPVEVAPFRACLLAASTRNLGEFSLIGCDYEVIRDVPGRPVEVHLLGPPGTEVTIRLPLRSRRFTRSTLDGAPFPEPAVAWLSGRTFLNGGERSVQFPGDPVHEPWHRHLGRLEPAPLPDDAEALYEATCFATDSDALEVRSLRRSGPSSIPAVQAARRAFFEQPMFVNRGIDAQNLFDGNLDTFFIARRGGGALRVDLGEPREVDRIVIRIRDRERPELSAELERFADDVVAEVSDDLVTWRPVGSWSGVGTIAIAHVRDGRPVRYVRVDGAPRRIAEVEAYHGDQPLDRSDWRASNLLASPRTRPPVRAWSGRFQLPGLHPGAFLSVALEGQHGDEGAFVAVRVGDRYLGAPDRCVSYPSNTWEYQNVAMDSNYTYLIPLPPDLAGSEIEVITLGMEGGADAVVPEVWLTAPAPPLVVRRLLLEER